jgi:putative transposon-encoded protein
MAVKMRITFEGQETRVAYGIQDKIVKEAGNSAHVMVPKTWIGKKVVAVLLEPIEE